MNPEKVGAVDGLWEALKEAEGREWIKEPELNATNKRGKGDQRRAKWREDRVASRGLARAIGAPDWEGAVCEDLSAVRS